jgi:hypothetical protein
VALESPAPAARSRNHRREENKNGAVIGCAVATAAGLTREPHFPPSAVEKYLAGVSLQS